MGCWRLGSPLGFTAGVQHLFDQQVGLALGFPITDLQTLEETDYLHDALIRCLEVIGEAPSA